MILGICGLQSSGKDTIGDYLINNYGFKKFSFAEVLKDLISILFLTLLTSNDLPLLTNIVNV